MVIYSLKETMTVSVQKSNFKYFFYHKAFTPRGWHLITAVANK